MVEHQGQLAAGGATGEVPLQQVPIGVVTSGSQSQTLGEAIAMLRLAGGVALEPTGLVLASPPGRTSLARRLPCALHRAFSSSLSGRELSAPAR